MPASTSLSAIALIAASVLNAAPATALGSTYDLIKTYQGDTFFNDWTYYGHYDNLTNGDTIWVNRTVGDADPKLTYINSGGNAIVKVDNTSTVEYNYKRNSVRLTSNDAFEIGSVWVMDALHLPYGCSVWPAFWSTGVGATWPATGEIDTFEGVNNQAGNQMALHSDEGCTLVKDSATPFTGTANYTNCYVEANSNSGCTIIDGNSTSYGEDFAKAGGGVWVTEFAKDGISIWFYSRPDVPSAVTNANSSIDTTQLGERTAFWSPQGCDIASYFTPQELIIDITLCGDWAGQASTLASTGCPALVSPATCYTTYVLTSSNYDNAYFEIDYIKVYSTSSATNASAVSATATGTHATSTSKATETSTSATSGAGRQVSQGWLCGLAIIGALAFALL
ncbi:hypothetical protein NliqN6_6516 [Naganishia liquefaciens]|uniref:GH16 domain-containing protein n=1 Tax=Naganishia liquefaciens TaxID=104408 RepID=A0A8H3YHP4_9TREE|nr:hypothetical protein NliqN6_6516 [Naganishia liquefaciens]